MPLTEEDLKQIGGLITQTMAEATKAQGETMQKEIAKQVNGAMAKHKASAGENLTPEQVQEKIESALAEAEKKRQEQQTTQQQQGKGGQPDAQSTAQLNELKQANADLLKKVQNMEDKAKREEQARLHAEEKSALTQALQAAKVRGELMAPAIAYLHGDGRPVTRNKGGEIVFNFKGETGAVEELDLGAGVAAWLKTQEGKAFLPPVDVGGGGDGRRPNAGGGGKGANAGTALSLAEAAQHLNMNGL